MAMAHLTRNIIYLKDGDYAALGLDDITIYDRNGELANRETIRTSASPAGDALVRIVSRFASSPLRS